MLISAKRASVHDNTISLSPWLRAPLFLSHGSLYYSVIESQPRVRNYVELVTSVIDVDHWSDMWRIEFETEDSPGNSALLLNLLCDRDLLILNMESSVDAFSSRHVTSVLVSARSYESSRDLSHSERSKMTSFELRELEEDMLIYFWDQFAIDADGAPRIKIRQMHTYRQLHGDVQAGKRFVINRDGHALANDAIELSERAMRRLKSYFKTEKLVATSTVDTKDRIIRTTIFSGERQSVFHFQVVYSATDQQFLRWIYSEIYRLKGNIVKSQIRACPPCMASKLPPHDQSAAWHIADGKFNKVDITFEFVGERDEADNEARRLSEFEASLADKVKAGGTLCFIEKRSWT